MKLAVLTEGSRSSSDKALTVATHHSISSKIVAIDSYA